MIQSGLDKEIWSKIIQEKPTNRFRVKPQTYVTSEMYRLLFWEG